MPGKVPFGAFPAFSRGAVDAAVGLRNAGVFERKQLMPGRFSLPGTKADGQWPAAAFDRPGLSPCAGDQALEPSLRR